MSDGETLNEVTELQIERLDFKLQASSFEFKVSNSASGWIKALGGREIVAYGVLGLVYVGG